MAYEMKIRVVEQVLKAVDRDLKEASSESERAKLINRRSEVFSEIRRLKRLEWEEQHERVGFDDER